MRIQLSIPVGPMLCVLAGTSSTAVAGRIDFENVAASTVWNAGNPASFQSPGAYTSLTFNDGEGITASLTRTGLASVHQRFDVVAFNSFTYLGPNGTNRPATWGNRSLDPFYYYFQNQSSGADDTFRIDFSSPDRVVTGVSIEFGDFASGGGNVYLAIYALDGTLIDTLVEYWDGDLGGYFQTQTPAGRFTYTSTVPIGHIRFWGDGDSGPGWDGQRENPNLPRVYGNNSLYWDNLDIISQPLTLIPLPTGAGLAFAGLGVLAIRRRSRG
jgi:hypothetical protein